MKPDPQLMERLRFLDRVVRRESAHLQSTDQRLFHQPFTVQRVEGLEANPEEAERVEAFVGRFGRLQDTLGDKLLPAFLQALGERPGAAVDNLDLAERWELIPSADDWLAMRKLRNQMVHEYIEDPAILASALQSGHEFVPTLLQVAGNLTDALKTRGWAE